MAVIFNAKYRTYNDISEYALIRALNSCETKECKELVKSRRSACFDEFYKSNWFFSRGRGGRKEYSFNDVGFLLCVNPNYKFEGKQTSLSDLLKKYAKDKGDGELLNYLND